MKVSFFFIFPDVAIISLSIFVNSSFILVDSFFSKSVKHLTILSLIPLASTGAAAAPAPASSSTSSTASAAAPAPASSTSSSTSSSSSAALNSQYSCTNFKQPSNSAYCMEKSLVVKR